MRLNSMARRLLESVLAMRGYGLRELDAPPRGYDRFLDLYREAAPAPRTVFDIGVGWGTPWLYRAFPEAHFVLVEPLREFEHSIEEILRQYDAEYHSCCLGAAPGESEFQVHPWDLTGSGLYSSASEQAADPARKVEIRKVPVRTLDSIAEGCAPPCVLKIDTEGSELEVLRGGIRTLRSVELILLETFLIERHHGAPDLIDVAAWLKNQGFRLFDVVNIATVGPRRIPAYVDVAFLRTGSDAYRRLVAT